MNCLSYAFIDFIRFIIYPKRDECSKCYLECKSHTDKSQSKLPKYKVEVYPKPWGSIIFLMKAPKVGLLHTTNLPDG